MAEGPRALPAVAEPPPSRLGPALARVVGDAALSLTYRLVQAGSRAPYVAAGTDPALSRLYYTADDGWRAPIFHVPARPGSSGEPVLLAHGLGGTWRDFRLEPERCLSSVLAAQGFSVYILEHRGDRGGLAPPGARPFSVDDIAVRDLPAALDAVREHSGFSRVLCLGHALGAQILYLHDALLGAEGIAGLVALCGAVRFEAGVSATRQAGLVATLLPSSWMLPARRFQQAVSPFVVTGDDIASPDTSGPVARARLRHAAGDLHGGVVRQVARWVSAGHLTDVTGRLDVVGALEALPALVIAADADPTCPVRAAEPAASALGARLVGLTGGWGHLDPLLGEHAPAAVFPLLVDFFDKHRRGCWG